MTWLLIFVFAAGAFAGTLFGWWATAREARTIIAKLKADSEFEYDRGYDAGLVHGGKHRGEVTVSPIPDSILN